MFNHRPSLTSRLGHFSSTFSPPRFRWGRVWKQSWLGQVGQARTIAFALGIGARLGRRPAAVGGARLLTSRQWLVVPLCPHPAFGHPLTLQRARTSAREDARPTVATVLRLAFSTVALRRVKRRERRAPPTPATATALFRCHSLRWRPPIRIGPNLLRCVQARRIVCAERANAQLA